MGLTLTAADLLRFETASRTLLSPLQAPSVAAWRGEVSRSLRELLRADRAMFWLPTEHDTVHADNVDGDTLAGYRYFLEQPLVQDRPSPDPLVSRFARRRRAEGIEVYDHTTVDRLLGGRLRESAFHHEVERAGGLNHILAIHTSVAAPGGVMDVALAVYYEDPGSMPHGQDVLPLLHALVPSYKAGLEAAARFGAHRHALDAVTEPVAVLDLDGKELHRNPALGRLVAAHGGAAALAGAMRQVALAMATQQHHPPRSVQDRGPPDAVRRVAAEGGEYRLRASYLAAGAYGAGPSVVIAVDRAGAPRLPVPDALRERFGLTRREAEVALLLAEGLSNEQIAKRMFVSASTARTHTERVLAKLGMNSRKALALKLMEVDAAAVC